MFAKRHQLAGGIAAAAMLAGCVVAPVPLVENEQHEVWSGSISGQRVTIEERESNWYMPIVASPEGAAKLRSSRWSYSYYLVFDDSHQRSELPFLHVEVGGDGTSGWRTFSVIDGSQQVLAMRVAGTGWKDAERDKLAWVDYDIAVFSARGPSHQRKLRAVMPPEGGKGSAWNYIRAVSGGRYLEYSTEAGLHRYATLENTETVIAKPGS